ncbi:porin, partial [Burkholderia pseudomallei]
GSPDTPTGSFDFARLAGSSRVPNSVKDTRANLNGLVFGLMYGFGKQAAGGLAANSTVSAGLKNETGSFALGADYVE